MPVRSRSKTTSKTQFRGRTVQDVTDEILRIFGSDAGLRVACFLITVVTPSGNTMDLSWKANRHEHR